jgi:RibD C-terminal domain
MTNLIYGAIRSLDGNIADADGRFDWSEPDEEVHRFVNGPRAADRDPPHQRPGADLATQAIAAGLVDECHLSLSPIVVGGGKQSLPDDVRWELEPLDERRFGNGVVFLRYRTMR